MARHNRWHISGWLALALLPVLLPVALLAALGQRLGLLKATADLTADDVVSYLANWIEGRGGGWDWDDFTSITITDKQLDAIREEAAAVPCPVTDEGLARLRKLLDRARHEAELRKGG